MTASTQKVVFTLPTHLVCSSVPPILFFAQLIIYVASFFRSVEKFQSKEVFKDRLILFTGAGNIHRSSI